MDTDQQVVAKRLYWRSRRGLLELELLLVPFAREALAKLSEAETANYARLLEHDDLDIYDWLQGRQGPPDPSLLGILARIREFNIR